MEDARAAEKRQRKRIQNRINQRTFRSRHPDKAPRPSGPRKQRQYQVGRWRLDEQQQQGQTRAITTTTNTTTVAASTDNTQVVAYQPLPTDHHLLHLVKWNVFRGLSQNKILLNRLTTQYRLSDSTIPQAQPFQYCETSKFPEYSVIVPVTQQPGRPSANMHYCCDSLIPTATQRMVVHSSWINLIPFPRMRENLIKFEFGFDHSDLIRDLVGDLINLNLFVTNVLAFSGSSSSGSSSGLVREQAALPEGESGLIVWGEPYRTENWEATPEFLRKWAWAVAGCHELIDSTNHWRRARGEDPVELIFAD